MSPRQPQTPTGRRLFTDNEPGDMLESDGVTWDDVCAIEAEAIAARDAELRAAVEGLEGQCHDGEGLGCESFPCSENVSRAELYALLDQPVVPKP